MHYKNGREAKNGDRVVLLDGNGKPLTVGLLYGATACNDYCNGRLAQARATDPCPNLKECLHADDVAAALVPEEKKPIGAADVQAEVPLSPSAETSSESDAAAPVAADPLQHRTGFSSSPGV